MPIDRPPSGAARSGDTWRADRWATVGISIVILYTLIRNVLVAASRPFWFDELNTVIVAGQPTLGKVWYALRHAEDSAPLLYVLVEHLCARIIPRAEIAYRVPSILACACILWCLFVFIRTRSGPGVAFVCAALPLFTQIYWRYSVEARSYECVVACTAIALVCYQRVDQERWVIGLAASLFAAGAFHYYGFFVLAPFFVAEFVQAIKTRAVRWGVWLAIASGFLPMAAAYPILRQIKQFYGAHFWGQPTWAVVWNMYGRTPFRASLIAMVVLAIMSVVTIFVPVWRRIDVHSELFSANEHVVAIVLIALPVLEYVGIKLVHGALTMRYALALILGVSIAVSYSLRFLGRWVVVPASCRYAPLDRGTGSFSVEGQAATSGAVYVPDKLVRKAGSRRGPHRSSHRRLRWRGLYAARLLRSPGWRGRMVGLVDPTNAVAYAGSDSVDRQLSALSCCFALRVYDFRRFRVGTS